VVVSVDKERAGDADGDESAGTAPVSATTTQSRPDRDRQPGHEQRRHLNAGDVLRFTFDRDVSTAVAGAGGAGNSGVVVEGSNLLTGSEETLTCAESGTRATCTYDAATRTLVMTITGTPPSSTR
jgi:hypothetical protein